MRRLMVMLVVWSAPAIGQPMPDAGTPEVVPPLSPPRITGEAFAGLGTAVAGGIVGGFIGAELNTEQGSISAVAGAFALGAAAGYVLAMPIGVYLAGGAGDQHCSGSGAFLGSLAGFVPAIVLGAAVSSKFNDTGLAGLETGLVFGGPLAGAVIGCNLDRHYDPPPPLPPLVVGAHVTSVPLFSATF